MKRRDLMKFAATGIVLLTTARAASAIEMIDYKQGMIQKALADGKTVFVDYAADWCSTCKSQERTLKALRKANPDYNKMMFVRVDWDEYSTSPISTKYKIPRRSTLIVLKGNKELGRIVAGTGRGQIKKLLDTGLKAANM